jgi:RNA processing factor Prp31
MASKIDDLEKAVSHTIRFISRLKEESRTSPAKSSQSEDIDTSAPAGESRIRELTEENSRLLAERKEVRRRIRTVLREINKVKW